MDSGERLLRILQRGDLPLPIPDNFRLLLPSAPTRYVTKLDKTGHSWYDINLLDVSDP